MAEPKKYGVQAGAFSDKIWVGRLSKSGTVFLDKEDMTKEVIWAVAEWVMSKFDGSAEVRFRGKRIDIDVTDDVETDQVESPDHTDGGA